MGQVSGQVFASLIIGAIAFLWSVNAILGWLTDDWSLLRQSHPSPRWQQAGSSLVRCWVKANWVSGLLDLLSLFSGRSSTNQRGFYRLSWLRRDRVGIHISPIQIIYPFHRPVFIPWKAVASRQRVERWFWKYDFLTIDCGGESVVLRFPGGLFDDVLPAKSPKALIAEVRR